MYGEHAFEQGFENVYHINRNHTSIHLRCFDHVKCDIKWKLKELKVDEKRQNEIVGGILGREYQGKWHKGLVDCEDEEEMEKAGKPESRIPKGLKQELAECTHYRKP